MVIPGGLRRCSVTLRKSILEEIDARRANGRRLSRALENAGWRRRAKEVVAHSPPGYKRMKRSFDNRFHMNLAESFTFGESE